jgi:hypothetical protein
LYAYGLAVAGVNAAFRGDLASADALCDQALVAAKRPGSDPDRFVEATVYGARGQAALSLGAWRDAATHLQAAAETHRALGRLALVSLNLSGAATAYTMAGDPEAAVPLATESVSIARRVGMPTTITLSLSALAGALADRDPQQAKVLLDEGLRLQAGLEYEDVNVFTNGALSAARMRSWTLVLELTSRSIRLLHWNADRPHLAGMFNLAARVVATTDAEAAAVLQGAARRLATSTIPAVATSSGASHPWGTGTGRSGEDAPAASFITGLRRETTGLLRDALDETRLRVRRAEGEGMDEDHAVAYALAAIAHARHELGQET